MSQNQQEALFSALNQLLQPLVRILLRNGIPYGAISELIRKVYVQIAEQDFAVPGKKQTNSRISTITGLSRKEVQRLKGQSEIKPENLQRYNRAARVITGWVRDEQFIDKNGDPVPLPFEGTEISFSNLVKKFSGDVPPRAILDELLQVHVVEHSEGTVKLLARAYIPKTGQEEKLTILGSDVAGLINTIDHNIESNGKNPFFQRKVYYDNLSDEAIQELRLLIADKAQQMLELMDHWMAAHDRDVNPDITGSGRKAAGIGVYFFENDVDVEEE